jgi:hypothetical protein
MKKYGIIAATIFLLLGNNFFLFGQKSTINYDLSSYSLPDLQRKTLEFQFNLDQNRYYNNQRSVFDTSHSHNSNFSTDLTPSFSYYLNSKKAQFESYGSFNPVAYDYSKTYSEINKSVSQNYNPYIYYTGAYRYYLKRKLFLETDVDAAFNYNMRKDINQMTDPEDETKHSTMNSNISIPILVGWGRIERVEDARLAVYILDDLKKHNRLDKEISQEEIANFAQFLSKLQNERFFDSRDKKIWEIQQIDSFMVANNLVTNNDAVFFTLINDNWDYASGPIRESGFRVSGGILNGLSNYISEYAYSDTSMINDKSKETDYNIHFKAKLVYEKPLNLYWQVFINDDFESGPTFNNNKSKQSGSDEEISKSKDFNINNTINAGLEYYPNSRTDMSISFNLNNDYYHRTNTSENANKDFDEEFTNNFSTGLKLTGNYYFSPQLRMTLNAGFNHDFTKREYEQSIENEIYRNNSGRLYVNLGVIYKII